MAEHKTPPETAALRAERPRMVDHVDHGPWRQVDRCVYCACGARLYQGKLPRSNRRGFAQALDATLAVMRARGIEDPPGP